MFSRCLFCGALGTFQQSPASVRAKEMKEETTNNELDSPGRECPRVGFAHRKEISWSGIFDTSIMTLDGTLIHPFWIHKKNDSNNNLLPFKSEYIFHNPLSPQDKHRLELEIVEESSGTQS